MTVQAFAGSIATRTSTGSQSTTGVGFQPKLVLFAGGTDSANDDTFMGSAIFGVGAATGSSDEWAICGSAVDNIATSNSATRGYSDRCCMLDFAGSTSPLVAAELTSMDSDGFTLNYTDINATARRMGYLALAGSELSVDAGTFQVPSAGASVAVTGVGFQPQCILLTHMARGTIGARRDHMRMGFGVATATNARHAMSMFVADNFNNSDSERMQLSDCVLIHSEVSGQIMKADLASFDSDGFTLSISDNPNEATDVGYIALRGGQFKVGVETQRTTTGTKATTGVGFQPVALIVFGACAASTTSITTGMSNMFGFSDGTRHRNLYGGDTDNAGTMISNRFFDSNQIIGHRSANDTTQAEASVSSFDSDGFTLNWGTADGTAREFVYLAIGSAPAATFMPKVVSII